MRRSLAVLLAIVGVLVLAACSNGSSTPSPNPSTNSSPASPAPSATATPVTNYTAPPATLPTKQVALSTSAPPWLPPLATDPQGSADYVAAAGLPYASEMLTVHYHAHLDINVNGKAVTVPQYIGFVAQGNKVVGLAPLHTHDPSGIVHIENSVPADFLLGQVFIEWGVRFTPHCLGPYCADTSHDLAVFVNGKRYAGDPTRLVLAKHQEIAIAYGPTGHLPTPPSSYAFPAGD